MRHEREDDAPDEPGLTAVKLSLVGGFVGTLAGLKRRGLAGAAVGGLLGGTAGYVAGSALEGPGAAEKWEDPLADVPGEPVTVDVGKSDEGEESEGEEAAEEDTDGDGDESEETDETEDEAE